MNQYLRYANTSLVPYGEEHYEKSVEWLNDPNVYKLFGITRRITRQSHAEWVKSLNNTYMWAIYDVKHYKYCGNLLLFYNPIHRSAFFQIYLGDPQSRGKGLGESALIAMINYAFENLNFHRIWLQVFPDNKKAIRLYEKLGFIYEGIERESHYSEKKFKNQLRYSILKSEWNFGNEMIKG
ncbi:GNAT family N-acetyltransferase [Sporosarcina koreensis]|uniref:GNAT family N-acetyltransferase n=1 Tax=Sporosarcina koreensis TaxID=334735 RepID=UPI00075DA547|nr:GNAT family protein [Sporosarcina koreensis]